MKQKQSIDTTNHRCYALSVFLAVPKFLYWLNLKHIKTTEFIRIAELLYFSVSFADTAKVTKKKIKINKTSNFWPPPPPRHQFAFSIFNIKLFLHELDVFRIVVTRLCVFINRHTQINLRYTKQIGYCLAKRPTAYQSHRFLLCTTQLFDGLLMKQ